MSVSASNNLSSRAAFSTSSGRSNQAAKVTSSPAVSQVQSDSSASSAEPTTSSQPLPEKMEPKLQITFTCTVSQCGERSTHQFSKQAYEKGVVLVQCPKCKNRYSDPI